MEIAKVTVSGVRAETVWAEPIPVGISGAKVTLEFTDARWAGLEKHVMFVGAKDVPVLYAGESVELPAEVVTVPNIVVKMGVWGIDAKNNIAIPTLWAELGTVRPAVDKNMGSEPKLPIWAQLLGMIGNLQNLDTTAKDNLVAAINEVAKGTGGGSVQPDYNQNDEAAADHIKNRPFYTGTVGENVYCDVEVLVSDGWGTIFPKPTLEPDTTYNVLFDGGWYGARYNGDTLGNEALWGGNLGYELAEGELPFCVDCDGVLGTNRDGVHTLKIYRKEPIVHTMDPVYLPSDYKPAVNIQRLADISSDVQVYKASREAWAKTFALAKAVYDGECVAYCALPMVLACGIESCGSDANHFTAYYVLYENGFNEGNQTLRIRTKRHTMWARYDSVAHTVTVTPDIWKHAEPVWEISVAGEELGGVKNGGNVVINEDGTMTAGAGIHTGPEPPEDTSSLWVDTDDDSDDGALRLLPPGGTPDQVLTIGEDGNPVWADPPAGNSSSLSVSPALMGPGAAVVDGVTLSTMEIPDETEETTE